MGLFIGLFIILVVLFMVFAMALAEWADKDPGDLIRGLFSGKAKEKAAKPVAESKAGEEKAVHVASEVVLPEADLNEEVEPAAPVKVKKVKKIVGKPKKTTKKVAAPAKKAVKKVVKKAVKKTVTKKSTTKTTTKKRTSK